MQSVGISTFDASDQTIRLRWIKLLIVVGFAVASLLSAKTAFEINHYASHFPGWFAPAFAVGIVGLIGLSLLMAFETVRTPGAMGFASGKTAMLVWALVLASFYCVTSVHGFFPLRPQGLHQLVSSPPILQFNGILALLGVLATAGLAGLYWFTPQKSLAVLGLLTLGLVVLFPNDQCLNPFNYWWINTIGLSPLMYLPSLFAVLFGSCALLRARPTINLFLIAGICGATYLLGLGHMARLIW
jgi:hypothetical protein